MSSPYSPRPAIRLLASLSFIWLTSTSLYAHHLSPGMEDVDEFENGVAFMAGLRHPLLGMDHWLLAMSVGFLAASGLLKCSCRSLAIALIAGISGGAALGLQAIVLPSLPVVILLPILLLTMRTHLPAKFCFLLVFAATFWQGNDHGIAWPMAAGTLSYLAGLLMMTTGIFSAGSSLVWLADTMRKLSLTRAPAV